MTASGSPNARADTASPPPWRSLRFALLALVALYGAYLGLGNLFLRTGIGPSLLGRDPEKLQASWAAAWTVWPGRIEVQRLRLIGQTQRTRWEVELEEGAFDCRVLSLALKRFTARDVDGKGLRFRLLVRPEPGDETDPRGAAPEIRGFASPLASPEEPPPPPRRWPWRVSLGGVEIDEVREVWIGDQRLAGSGRLAGDWTFVPRGQMEMDLGRFEIEGGRIFVGAEPIAEDVSLHVDAHFDRFVPREHRGRAVLRFLSGRVRFESPRSSFGFVDRYFARAPWLEIGGSGRVRVDVPIDGGVLAPGSTVEIDAGDVRVEAFDFLASGEGEVRGSVAEAAAAGSRLTARMTAFELRRADEAIETPPAPLARGASLELSIEGGAIDLAAAPPDLAVRLAVPESEIPDLVAYNRFLPRDGGLEVRSGSGTFAGELSLDTRTDEAEGEFEIRAQDGTVAFAGAESTGDTRLVLRINDADLERLRFDVSGTRLEMQHFTVEQARGTDAGWWAQVELGQAQVQAREPISLAASVDASLRDSRPVVAFLAEQKPLLTWIDGLLTVEDVKAEGRVVLEPQAWTIDDLRVTGESLEVLGDDLRLSRDRHEGLLYFARGRLAAAVEVKDGKRDWKVLRARRWFEARAGREGEVGRPE